MDNNLNLSFVLKILILFAALSASNTQAATRSCTAAERNLANQQLHDIGADTSRQSGIKDNHLPFGIHQSDGTVNNEHVMFQEGYILKHDHDLRTSLWVSYKLTETDVHDAAGNDRVNCFRRDPRLVFAQAATPADYSEPVFDQGHLANDADLKDDLTQQINSYIMSNMSPQHCRFNRGIWLSLEHLTRAWAKEYKTIFVTSGAIFDQDGDAKRDNDAEAQRMVSNSGRERVAIPSHYYKVIVRQDNNVSHAIAFLLKNTNDSHGVAWRDVRPHVIYSITNLSVIEELTGITFHPSLDRNQIHQEINAWNLSEAKANSEATCH